MPELNGTKLLARNVAAVRRSSALAVEHIAGNPVSTRLESGVGNCFPGLECDLRNLERRFLPYLEVEFLGFQVALNVGRELIMPVAVDLEGVERAVAAGELSEDAASVYRDIRTAISANRLVVGIRLSGTFGILGPLDLDLLEFDGNSASGLGRQPPDLWTAVRMLTENTPVQVTFVVQDPDDSFVLETTRARYLDDNGALSAVFLPGELTQSLCSPWTHDFRDCGCFYWASNHPDIVQPVYPAGTAPLDPQPWTVDVAWQRRARQIAATPPPSATTASAQPLELRHYEINRRWQELHFVIGRRETTTAFKPVEQIGRPLPDLPTLLAHLRYAAGVELGVAQEYLTAAYSLKADDDASLGGKPQLRDDVRATRAELMRIAVGEMRHTRAVNDVIRAMMPPGEFAPALRVARLLPPVQPGVDRPVVFRPADRAAIEDFISIEAPSAGVDGLYFDILATLQNPPADVQPLAAAEWTEAISSIIAEGEDHYQTFLDMREWLDGYAESEYLRSTNPPRPSPGQADHDALQQAYVQLLENLHAGYGKGRLAGAGEVNAARVAMIAEIDPRAHAVAERGKLVVFDEINDARFKPIDPP
ncbi:ferritin-like domain-containing protein [Rhizobium leguminosarum]